MSGAGPGGGADHAVFPSEQASVEKQQQTGVEGMQTSTVQTPILAIEKHHKNPGITT